MSTENKPQTSAGDILLLNVVLDWPNLFRPGGRDGDTPRYGATFNMSPDHPQIPQIKAAIRAACKDKWPDQAKEMYELFERKGLTPLRDGNEKQVKYPYLKGMLFLATASPQDKPKPATVNQIPKEVDESAGLFYRGAIVNAKIQIWAQKNKFGERINAQLRGVQFVSRGEPLGSGGAASVDEFEAIGAPAETSGADDWA